MSSKYIIVTGGVFSGCGKGVAAASVGFLMKLRGHKIQLLKMDPYLSINNGGMSPLEHGETYLCDDGRECDLDIGHYFRLAGVDVSSANIYTSGSLYSELIGEVQEKNLGKTLQVIPHLTNLIIEKIETWKNDAEITIVEIGGTVGDVESGHFYEAIRQFKHKYYNDVLVAMVAPILWVPTIKEFKTKPLQNAVRTLQQFGIQPDMLLCRVDYTPPKKVIDKISTFTNVPKDCIIEAPDVDSIYQVPIKFYEQNVDDIIADKFRFKRNACKIFKYRELVEKIDTLDKSINIGVFGKYDNCHEAYISLREALFHAGLSNDVKVDIQWINAEEVEKNPKILNDLKIDGAIVPGGFDNRGVEGKIQAIKYVRENKIPFLGICLGLQCAVIEYARNVCNLPDSNSLEFDKNTKTPIIHYVKGQESITKKMGTMRLGAYDCELNKNSMAFDIYGKKLISERHRHRYEVNPAYQESLENKGFFVVGINPESNLIEVMELNREIHPFFIGTQAHPEFKSRLVEPAPLFKALVQAAKNYAQSLANNHRSR